MLHKKQFLWKFLALAAMLLFSLIAVIPSFAEPSNPVMLLTPTVPQPTDTPSGELLPDLTISHVSITLQGSCLGDGGGLGTRVTIQNSGSVAAGSFVVDINGTEETIAGLAANSTLNVWVAGYVNGNNTVIADVHNNVVESNENNNQFFGPVPIPTPPPPCPTVTPTSTPSLPSPEAEISVSTELLHVGETLTLLSEGNLALGQHKVLATVNGETAVIGMWNLNELVIGPDSSIVEIVSATSSPPSLKAGFELLALAKGVVELKTNIHGEICTDSFCYFTSAPSQTIAITILGSCSYAQWSADEVYVAGDLVFHNNQLWRAKWWTLNEEPGTTGQYGVWEALDGCPAATPTPTPPANGDPWLPDVAYQLDDIVSYNGNLYRCQIAHTSMVGWEPDQVPALWVQQ